MPPQDDSTRPTATMVEPKITMGRMPNRPASQPATMPPKAAPT
jgi:hypothetical protein